MMPGMKKTLLSEIDAFRAISGLSDYTFGLRAARNGRLVQRLRDGGRVWPETEAMVRSFIRSEMKRLSQKTRKAA